MYRSSSRVYSNHRVKVTNHLHVVKRLRRSGAIPQLPLYAFMAWRGTTFRFCAHSCTFLKQIHNVTGKYIKSTNPTLETAGIRRQNLRLLSEHIVTRCWQMSTNTVQSRRPNASKPSAREHTRSGQMFDHKKLFIFRPDISPQR
jgi:hypothetical protein